MARDAREYGLTGDRTEVWVVRDGQTVHKTRVGEPATSRRTHGIGLTPDESEVWLSDQGANTLIVYDNTVMPPAPKRTIKLNRGGHGWITFSLAGDYAWCHTQDVIDPETKDIVATLLNAEGEPIASSKFFEAHFEDGKLVAVGHQFALGYKNL